MPNTDSIPTLGIAVRDLLVAAKVELGVYDVLYGDHKLVSKSPTIIVMPGRKVRSLKGVSSPGGRVKNELNLIIDVLTSDVLSGESISRLALDQLADLVEKKLHADTTIGGLVIHGFVVASDPGERPINDSMFRLVRLYYTAESRTYLSG